MANQTQLEEKAVFQRNYQPFATIWRNPAGWGTNAIKQCSPCWKFETQDAVKWIQDMLDKRKEAMENMAD